MVGGIDMSDYNLKKVLCQLNQWCATNNISVQSVYDECHGMSLQDLVYYLLGVVKEAVNQVVENTDTFKELYDFVHDYFDNLDVQEEINNKLDEMVYSGELTTILKPLFVITDEMQKDIAVLKNKIGDGTVSEKAYDYIGSGYNGFQELSTNTEKTLYTKIYKYNFLTELSMFNASLERIELNSAVTTLNKLVYKDGMIIYKHNVNGIIIINVFNLATDDTPTERIFINSGQRADYIPNITNKYFTITYREYGESDYNILTLDNEYFYMKILSPYTNYLFKMPVNGDSGYYNETEVTNEFHTINNLLDVDLVEAIEYNENNQFLSVSYFDKDFNFISRDNFNNQLPDKGIIKIKDNSKVAHAKYCRIEMTMQRSDKTYSQYYGSYHRLCDTIRIIPKKKLVRYPLSRKQWIIKNNADNIAKITYKLSNKIEYSTPPGESNITGSTNWLVSGIPYSSDWVRDCKVGYDVSLKTMITSFMNPNSKMYSYVGNGDRSKTYYGLVCSSFGSLCVGLQYADFNISLISDKYQVEDVKSIADFEVGDLVIFMNSETITYHCAVITDKVYDAETGEPIFITYTHNQTPMTIANTNVNCNDFKTLRSILKRLPYNQFEPIKVSCVGVMPFDEYSDEYFNPIFSNGDVIGYNVPYVIPDKGCYSNYTSGNVELTLMVNADKIILSQNTVNYYEIDTSTLNEENGYKIWKDTNNNIIKDGFTTITCNQQSSEIFKTSATLQFSDNTVIIPSIKDCTPLYYNEYNNSTDMTEISYRNILTDEEITNGKFIKNNEANYISVFYKNRLGCFAIFGENN